MKRDKLLIDTREQVGDFCTDVQTVHISGPKGGKTVEVIRRYRCQKKKEHTGDHKDSAQYVGWPQGTQSPTKMTVGKKGGRHAELVQ
jgi:hypothetical protein